MNWYIKVLKQYTRFNGRARRKEFWYFNLISFLISLVLAFLDTLLLLGLGSTDRGLLLSIYVLGTLLPSYAVTIRRLHDVGKSGWWLLIGLIPLIGSLVLLCFWLQDSEPGANRFGRNPQELID